MQIEVQLPDMTGDDTEIVLDEYTVSEGDTVNEGDPIALVTAGKASDLEVPSPKSGKVAKLTAEIGEPVAVGAVIAMIEAGDAQAAQSEPTQAAPVQESPAPQPAPVEPQATEPQVEPAPAPQPAPTPQPAPAPQPSPAPQPAPAASRAPAPTSAAPRAVADASRLPAGPEIRRFAREVGVDLTQVQGTGPNGRILRDDVLEVVRAGNQAAENNAEAGSERDEYGPVHIEKLSGVRRTIAQQMHRSWTSVPRVTNFDDADVTELERMRQSSKGDYAAKNIKLTTMPFLIKAIAMSLREHPAINATIDMENSRVIYKDYVNIGIAVDTENGLVVPSLTNADKKSISEIAYELSDLAEKVRSNNFSGVPLKGSTFTISNLGAIGGTYSTPIVNIPEVAILLVGRSRKMPVVIDDEVVVRLVMPLSLSYDHRLIDGGAAAYFLNEVKGYLEAPSRLLLAP